MNTFRESKSSSWQQHPPRSCAPPDKVCSHTLCNSVATLYNSVLQYIIQPLHYITRSLHYVMQSLHHTIPSRHYVIQLHYIIRSGQCSGSSNVIQQEATAPKAQSVTRPRPATAACVHQGSSGYNYAASFRQTSATPSGNPAQDLSAMCLAATFGSFSTTSTPNMQSSTTSDLDASSGVRPSSSSSLRSSRNKVYLGSRPRSNILYARPAISASHRSGEDSGAGGGHWMRRVQNQHSFLVNMQDGSHNVVLRHKF